MRVFNWGDDLAYALDELIPACPTLRTGIQDPREPQILYQEHRGGTSERYNSQTGELVLILGDDPLPAKFELKLLAATVRKRESGLAKLVFVISNTREDDICVLVRKGFAREEGHWAQGAGIALAKTFARRFGNSDERKPSTTSALKGEASVASKSDETPIRTNDFEDNRSQSRYGDGDVHNWISQERQLHYPFQFRTAGSL